MLFVLLGSCRQNLEEKQSEDVRIVSLSPGITNTLIDAGYEEKIVGRSPFCLHANQSVPIVGDLLEIDYERLLKLNPSHVFIQKTTSNLDEHLLALASKGKFELHTWQIQSLDDIKTMYGDLTEMLGGSRENLEIDVMQNGFIPSPVLVITQGVGSGPGLCFGKETYIDDVIQEMGVENAVTEKGWLSLSLEDIGRLQPSAIIVVSESDEQFVMIENLRSIGIPVIPFTHEHVLLPSSEIVDVAKKMQELKVTK
jgi:ABC-type hemin transport system substrate-binding protein